MKRKRVGVSFLIASVVLTVILAVRLVQMGRSPSEVFVSTIVFLIFLVIPIIGAMRSLEAKELGMRSESQKRRLLVLRVIVLFVVAPLLGGLIYYVTYPSISLAMPLAVAVLVGASIFFFFVK